MSFSFKSLPRPSLILLLAALAGAPAIPAADQAAGGPLPAPVLVADLAPGSRPNDFVPREIAEIDGLFYFSGWDPQHGDEPWVSDGTPAGTRLLADLCPGQCPSYPRDFKALGERVLFLSYTLQALYAIEGGEALELRRDLGETRLDLQVLGEIAYFSTGAGGNHHWRTDGTAAGTRLTGIFCSHTSTCNQSVFEQRANGAIYFLDYGILNVLVAEGDRRRLANLRSFDQLTELDATRVVFEGCTATACAVWVSNGTAAGTFPLDAGSPPGTSTRRHFVAWQGRVYFADPTGAMMSTDGSTFGTRAEPSFTGIRPTPFAATPDALLYTVDLAGQPLRQSLRSRQAGGADLELVAESGDLRVDGAAGGKIFFYSSITLMATDGSLAGTHALYEAYGRSPGVEVQGLYYFGLDPNGGEIAGGLWRSNGTPAGTVKLDLGQRVANSTISFPNRLGSTLTLYTSSSWAGLEQDLYFVDPQTLAFRDAHPGQLFPLAFGRQVLYADQPLEHQLVAVREQSSEVLMPLPFPTERALAEDDHLFFAPASGPGQKLYESDGTAAGTRLLFDLDPGYTPTCGSHHCEPSFPQQITPSGRNVFFVAPSATDGGATLWVYRRDGGAPAELLLLPRDIDRLVAAPGGRVIFPARIEPSPMLQLWQSDGTVAGTRPFLDLPQGEPALYARAGGRVFFALRGASGSGWGSLWVTDLTASGSFPAIAHEGLSIDELVAAGDNVYFSGRSAAGQDAELGFSDGTPAGTRWLEVVPGPHGLRPERLFALDDRRVVFGGAGDAAGEELWISDGSLPGTFRLTDLAPGAAASNPQFFAQVGNRLFFNGDDGATGNELWALDLVAPRPGCPADRLCLHDGRFEVKVTALAPGAAGAATRWVGQRALGNDESGVFTFFSQNNWELSVKVLDACEAYDSYWVFAAAASDVAYEVEVLDRATGASKRYLSAAGAGRPIIDTGSDFACAGPPVEPLHSPSAPPPAPAAQRCAGDPEKLCLGEDGRFEVGIDWDTADQLGHGHPVWAGSEDSGLFTFFSPSNWEMMVKVLDGCAINGKFWVFAAGTTDVGWTLTVKDRQTQRQKTYRNNFGQPSASITDSAALDCR